MKRYTMLLLILIIATMNQLMAQSESFDIFTFTPQPGWTRKVFQDNIQFTIQQGNHWAVVTFFTGTGTKGDLEGDFQFDWNDLIGKNYTLTGEVSKEANSVNGWQMMLGTATGTAQGQNLNLSLLTFTGPGYHSTIVLLNNDFNNVLDQYIQPFMAEVSVVEAQSWSANNISQSSPMPGMNQNTYTPITGVSSGNFPTPGEQQVIESVTMDEGWFVEATNDYVQYSKPDIKVIQYFLTETPYPDKDGYWRQILSRYFSADRYNVYDQGPSYFSTEFAYGNMAYKPDGRQYFVAWLVSSDIASAFVAITSSESVYRQYFPEPKSMGEMTRFNNFPVNIQTIQGEWAESSSSGAQMYQSGTGNYAGMALASASNSFTFSGNNFRFFTQGSTGMVGSSKVFQEEEKGNFSLNNYTLVTNTTSRTDQMTNTTTTRQEQTEYAVAFKYAKNTGVLFMQNKRSSGLKFNLVRK